MWMDVCILYVSISYNPIKVAMWMIVCILYVSIRSNSYSMSSNTDHRLLRVCVSQKIVGSLVRELSCSCKSIDSEYSAVEGVC